MEMSRSSKSALDLELHDRCNASSILVCHRSCALTTPDFIHLWADVPIEGTDDVGKLLAQRKFTFTYQSALFPLCPIKTMNWTVLMRSQRIYQPAPMSPSPSKPSPAVQRVKRRRNRHGR